MNAQRYVPRQGHDDLFNAVLNGQQIARDKASNLIHIDSIRERFFKIEIAYTDDYTRPKFINNIYQKGVDGIVVPYQLTDSFHVKEDNHKYRFNTIHYEEEDLDRERPICSFAFIVLKKEIGKRVSFTKYHNKALEMLFCSADEYWKNDSISIKSINYALDSCSYEYRLSLSRNFEFNHSYNGNKQCVTESMEAHIKVYVEGDVHDFRKYSNKIQGCKITHSTGSWNIEQNHLVFRSEYGYKLFSYHIKQIKTDTLELQNEGYFLRMVKQRE